MFFLIASALPAEAEDNRLSDQAKAILDNASEFELFSLDPREKLDKAAKADTATVLDGWKIVGKTTVNEAETRKHLAAAVQKDIVTGGRYAECFEPRHAIRATYEGKTVTMVICFKCRWMHVSVADSGGAQLARQSLQGFDTDSRLLLDKVLRDANVPLKKPTEIMALSQLIGTWDTQTTVKIPNISFQVPGGGLRTSGSIKCEWVLGERFIQGKATDSLNQESLVHWTYDVNKKAYRMWLFRSGGGVEDSSGQWFADSKNLVMKNDIGNGIINASTLRPQDADTFTIHIKDADTIEFNGEAKDGDGKLYFVTESKWTRRK